MRSPTVISTIYAPCPPDALHPGPFAPGVGRAVVAWAALTLASLTGPCRPLSPALAFAAEASP